MSHLDNKLDKIIKKLDLMAIAIDERFNAIQVSHSEDLGRISEILLDIANGLTAITQLIQSGIIAKNKETNLNMYI